MTWQVLQGDCIERMAEMEEASVDAVVCDPPYGIGFMGHEWDQPGKSAALRSEGDPQRPGLSDDPRRPAGGGALTAGRYDLSLTANRRYQAWCEAWAKECLRVLKPGGHLLACGGSRTHHRLVSGIEDAGFEIRDRIDCPDGRSVETPDGTLAWIFGSGFPKSADVHKQLAKWGARVCAAWLRAPYDSPAADRKLAELLAVIAELEAPVEDQEWQGWGTALKPAHEPIVVARKPLIGTVAENLLEHGTGGINIDACKVSGSKRHPGDYHDRAAAGGGRTMGEFSGSDRSDFDASQGRHPANVVLSHLEDCEQVGTRVVKGGSREDRGEEAGGIPSTALKGGADGSLNGQQSPGYADEDGNETVEAWSCAPGCPVAELDRQSGRLQSGLIRAGSQRKGIGYHGGLGNTVANDSYGDTGGASRFFYQAKCSRAERNAGLEGLALNWSNGEESPGTFQGDGTDRSSANHHPTVKPINLMRWLVRLVTPPGGVVLDNFGGSGSTGCAAVLEGFDVILIEREPEYVEICKARVAFWAQHEGREVEDVLGSFSRSTRAAAAKDEAGQLGLELA